MNVMTDTQTQIVRQSSLKFINEYLQMVEQPIGLYETVAAAELVTDYVLNGRSKNVNQRLQAFDEFLLKNTSRDLVEKIKFEMQE
jgi:hypothetical protein